MSDEAALDTVAKQLARLTETTQNLFILEALKAGAATAEVREFLRIDQMRVSAVSKLLAKGSPKKRPQ